ncbi:MAG: M28 family peptidase [Acidobacteriota bacterium]
MTERRVIIFFFLLAFSVVETWLPGTSAPRSLLAQGIAPYNDSIRKEDLRADLFFLASDEMKGRLSATPENSLAGAFIKSRFERLGLKPAGPKGSFYQPYHLITASLGEENHLDLSFANGATLRPQLGQDYYPLRFSASGTAQGSLMYAGFGISSPERSHDDYGDAEIKGKIVLVLNHEPGEDDPESPFDGVVAAEVSRPLRKTLLAQRKGASGILFVRDVHNHPDPENFEAAARAYWPETPRRTGRYSLASWVEKIRIPAARISPALAEILLGGAGRTLADLSRGAESSGGITPMPLPGVRADLTTSLDRHVVPDRNVVALAEGSDPALKDEWVIVCAHYDHNGADGNRIFNGADDDGSGTAGLIEIAEAYAMAARDGERPRRSVLFAAWNSEERGLLGSWAYTEQPLSPLESTVAVLNMDMIGRNEEVPVGGGRRFRGLDLQTAESNRNAINILGYTYSADLKSELETTNKAFGLELKMRYDNNRSNLLRRSDHWPFLQRGVPALFFHTGLHPDYHTVNDRPEKIQYDKLEKIVRLVHQMSWNLAQAATRPRLSRTATPGTGR